MSSTHVVHKKGSLMEEMHDQRHLTVHKCYQCGKCSAGCPVSEDMDYPPSVIMRLVQTESKVNEDKALRSMTAWLCVTCETCATRCPMEIDIPGVMDFLRERSLQKGITNPGAKNIISFHKSFLDCINQTGRLTEIGLVADYKMRSFHLTQDVDLVPAMIARGKLNPIPEIIKGRKNILSIFNKTLKKGGKK